MTTSRLAIALVLVACTRDDAPRPASRGAVQAGSSRAAAMLERGAVHYKAQQYDSARAVWVTGLAEARAAGDSIGLARLHTELGYVGRWLGRPVEAAAHHDSAIALKTQLRMQEELARSLNGRGLVALSENQNAEALVFFERAIQAAAAVRDGETIGKSMSNMGLAYAALGDLKRARAGHRVLAQIGRDLNDAYYQAQALANEATVDLEEGNPATAIARLDSARALYRRADRGRDAGEQNIFVHLATAAEGQGEYDRAFALLDTALTLARRHKLTEKEIEATRMLAELHRHTGDHRVALRLYDQAIEMARRTGVHADLASSLLGAAESNLAVGNLTRARMNAEAAFLAHAEYDETAYQVADLLLLAELDDRDRRTRSVDARMQTADSLARLLTPLNRADVALARARRAERQGRAREALRHLTTIDTATRAVDFALRWSAAAIAARAYGRLGSWDSAAAAGREAVDALERLRSRLPLESMRSSVASERANVYAVHVMALLRLGREEDAFVVADRARSRGLIEELSAVERGSAVPGIPRELVEGEEILRRIDALLRALRQGPQTRPPGRGAADGAASHADFTALTAARSEYEALMARAGRGTVRTAALGMDTTSVAEVQRALEPGEVLIEYFVANDSVVVFGISRDRLRVRLRALSEETLHHRVRLLRDLWTTQRSDWRTGLPAARALHDALMSPMTDMLTPDVRRLVIVPHGVLGQVPFAALRSDSPDRFMAERYALLYAPSSAAFVASRRAKPRQPAGTAEGFAPFTGELPASGAEVAAFTSALPRAGKRVGVAATEASLRAAVRGGGIVHVATHGVMNASNPMFSRIELARGSRRGASHTDDGRLELREVVGLDVRTPLLFLSGCETGAFDAWLDSPVRGAGGLSLSQAFLSAGAANVVSTLWRIDDAGAAALAQEFYRNLAASNVTDALARAQRELIRHPRFGNPYYWAAYVLSGDGRFSMNPQKAAVASVY